VGSVCFREQQCEGGFNGGGSGTFFFGGGGGGGASDVRTVSATGPGTLASRLLVAAGGGGGGAASDACGGGAGGDAGGGGADGESCGVAGRPGGGAGTGSAGGSGGTPFGGAGAMGTGGPANGGGGGGGGLFGGGGGGGAISNVVIGPPDIISNGGGGGGGGGSNLVPAGGTAALTSDPPQVAISFPDLAEVVVEQAAGQADPTGVSPIHFTAVFSEPVSGFGDSAGDVVLSGPAGATDGVVTEVAPNDGTTYDVAVSGMRVGGTVTVSVPAGVASDGAGNANTASTSSDNTVTWQAPAAPPPSPSPPSPSTPPASPTPPVPLDTQAPTAPGSLQGRLTAATGRIVRTTLTLTWTPASDNTGIDTYLLERNNSPLQHLPGSLTTTTTALRGPAGYQLSALDTTGNHSQTVSLTIVLRPRPQVRTAIPAWAWQLLRWRATPTAGRGNRPAAAPTNVPAWYWPWAGWRLNPYQIG
jgi:hypothetical protein